ncbi:lipopolysaccharide biosynthesis protein [Paraliomyxa miuraensis]|uniref:lipopolysaccharide biosynthesis protein n=1 Tax=Paraliomyxa miuraensis TaxID=376150 RepID=UPI00225ABE75|nr:hypothetical protein [Paraliomyxa miuraensis]MCX4246332.1 hypothetical protein [Paraliomyxa miuraensis]
MPDAPAPPEPTPSRPLWHDAAWSLLGEAGYAAGLLATVVLLARLGSEQTLGQYTLGMALATPAILLTNLHLRPAYVVDEGRWCFEEYLGLRLCTIPLALVLLGLGVVLMELDVRTAAMVMAVGGLRAWEALSDVLLAPAQKAQRLAAVGCSRALRGLLTAIGVGLGPWLTGDPLGGMVLALILLGGLSLGFDLAVARRHAPGPLRLRLPTAAILGLIRRTLPIGLAAAILAASTNAPAYALERFHDVGTVGRFGAVAIVMMMGQLVNVALGNAAIPRLARAHHEGRLGLRPIGRLLLAVAVVNGLLVLGALCLGPTILRVVYGPAFGDLGSALLLAAAVAWVAGLANILSQAVTAAGRFGQQLVINAIALCGSVGLSLWLVPAEGLRGALWALLLLSGLRLVIYAAVTVIASRPLEEIEGAVERGAKRCRPRTRASTPTPRVGRAKPAASTITRTARA